MLPVHVIINESKSRAILQELFPCYECGKPIRPDAKFNRIAEQPVLHSIQSGTCYRCGSNHLVFTARTKADCVMLEPVVKSFASQVGGVEGSLTKKQTNKETNKQRNKQTMGCKMIEFTKDELSQVLAAVVVQYEAFDDLIDCANAGTRPDTEHVEFLTGQRDQCESAYLKLDPRGIQWVLAKRRAVS